MKQKIKIISETEREILTSRRKFIVYAWCDSCDARTRMINIEEAAQITNASYQTIQQMVESKQLHSIKLINECLLVCLSSLRAAVEKNQSHSA